MPQHHGHPGGQPKTEEHLPRLIAWEVTRRCILNCKHCRAAATRDIQADEFSTEECFKLLDNIASFSRPIIILTGGEPMLREDIYDIAAYAHKLDLPVVMAPCGMLLNDETAAKIAASGVKRISISLDGSTAATHDEFRGHAGSFDACIAGIAAAKRAGLDFQINTTVSRHNSAELEAILQLSIKLGASVFNPFLLVPTGRGKALIDQELSAAQYEQTLQWLAERQARGDIPIRVTCAPHYQRILRQRAHTGGERPSGGCMGGKSFMFVSHMGKVQICGFLDIECGDVREAGYDLGKIWRTSLVFLKVRDEAQYAGRCGGCEFHEVCGGCRARAYAMTGDYLGEEPFCVYQPRKGAGRHASDVGILPASAEGVPPSIPHHADAGHELTDLDRKVLSAVQTEFPITDRPFDVLAGKLGIDGPTIQSTLRGLMDAGHIRRFGAVFDARQLGYVSTLVAAKIPPQRLDEVAAIVSALPGVTHNYSRPHAYNLWFTLTCPNQPQLDTTLAGLRHRTGIEDFRSLPALAVYKSQVLFQFDESPAAEPTPQQAPASALPAAIDERGKALVRLLQGSLPIVDQPYAELAAELGVSTIAVMEQIKQWLSAGVIKRLGAVVAHRKLGFVANGMAVFIVPPDRLQSVGEAISKSPAVSHCYTRPTFAAWPFNLFAMVHGRDERQVRKLVAELAAGLDLGDYDILFSTTEYKKVSMRYFTE